MSGSQSYYHTRIFFFFFGLRGRDWVRLAGPKNRPGRKRWKEIQRESENICLLSHKDKQAERESGFHLRDTYSA